MRYHHSYGCYGHGWHWGCGPDWGWGPASDWAWGPDVPFDYPPRYGRRGRLGGRAASRRSTLSQLEGYLASLQEEIRAVEQDMRDLAAQEAETGEEKA